VDRQRSQSQRLPDLLPLLLGAMDMEKRSPRPRPLLSRLPLVARSRRLRMRHLPLRISPSVHVFQGYAYQLDSRRTVNLGVCVSQIFFQLPFLKPDVLLMCIYSMICLYLYDATAFMTHDKMSTSAHERESRAGYGLAGR